MNDDLDFEFYEEVILRAPYYSFARYKHESLAEVLADPAFRNALWLASPSFCRLLETKGFNMAELSIKEQFSLQKYFNRMSFRPTPFGAFSTFSLIKWDKSGIVRFDSGKPPLLHILPSRRLQAQFESMGRASDTDCSVMANPTLYRVGNIYRYVKTIPNDDGKLIFNINELDAEELNVAVLKLAAVAVQYSNILRFISDSTGCEKEEAGEYGRFLLGEQVLISEYEGNLFAPGYDKMAATGVTCGSLLSMGELWGGLKQVELSPVLDLAGKFRELDTFLKPGGIIVDDDHFYSAMERPDPSGGLSPDTQNELILVINLLKRLVIPYSTPSLKNFKEAFKIKFDTERVSLMKALDPDTGVGYGKLYGGGNGTMLTDGLDFSVPARSPRQLDWTPIHKLLMRIWLSNSKRAEFDPVEVTFADGMQLGTFAPEYKLPQTLALLFTKSDGKIVLDNAGGASATSLIGRFSVFNEEIEKLCRQIASFESAENQDVEFAEIHQLSDEHTDNINFRRPVYGAIITINTYAADTGQMQIPLSDLVVSIQRDELIIESVTQGKRIIPRLPTAYNFQHNDLAVFQMLCDLQYEGLQANLTFDLERLFPELNFYPRVFCGNVVLSVAKWRLNDAEVADIVAEPRSIGKLHLFRQRRGIPRMVTLGLSDRQLVFDLADDRQALFFIDCLNETKPPVIYEYMLPDNSVRSGKSSVAGQFLTLLKRPGKIFSATGKGIGTQHPAPVQRSFLPGGNWLYLKVYCTEVMANQVLSNLTVPVLSEYGKKIGCWFFIRYHDPLPHLRIRIFSDRETLNLISDQCQRMLNLMKENGLIGDVVNDTYQREIERYSAGLIEQVELWFRAGSEWVLSRRDEMKENSLLPFWLAYRLTATFLNDGLSDFFKCRAEAFLKEFGNGKKLKLGLDRKFREYSKSLSGLLEDTYHDFEAGPLFVQLSLLSEATREWLPERRKTFLADLLHMQINRMFSSGQRNHEALIFYCLFKYEVGKAGRNRAQLSSPATTADQK